MTHIYQLLNLWRELIAKFFSDYPLAAALVTLLAIGVFLLLQSEWRKGKLLSNLLLVFLGWLVLVPILGFAVTVLGKVWPSSKPRSLVCPGAWVYQPCLPAPSLPGSHHRGARARLLHLMDLVAKAPAIDPRPVPQTAVCLCGHRHRRADRLSLADLIKPPATPTPQAGSGGPVKTP